MVFRNLSDLEIYRELSEVYGKHAVREEAITASEDVSEKDKVT
jgi:hypothetical protein